MFVKDDAAADALASAPRGAGFLAGVLLVR